MEQLTFKQWMQETYDQDELNDISQYGCVNGVSGLIYYSETNDIYDQYSHELHDVLGEWIDSVGEVPHSITQELGNASRFKNAVVWFVAELYARELSTEIEEA